MPGGNGKTSITVAPAKLPESLHTVTVYDSGQTIIHVVTQAVEIKRIHGVCQFYGEVTWAKISPGALMMYPGTHYPLHITLGNVPPGAHDLAVEAEALGGGKGQIHVNGAVAAQDLVIGRGHVAHPTKPCVALGAPATHVNWTETGSLILTPVLVITIAVWAFVLRRRHNRKATS